MATRQERFDLRAREVARAYDRLVSAWWRGEDDAATPVAAWFTARWTHHAPPEPDDAPVAANHLAVSGAEIHWYVRGDVIVGYISGQRGGCYRVGASEAVPMLKAPWELPPPERALTDRLVDQLGAAPVAVGNRGPGRAAAPIPSPALSVSPDQDHCLRVEPGPVGSGEGSAAAASASPGAGASETPHDAPSPTAPASGDWLGSAAFV
jgi:hypothetical protein